jgi:Domain of unknown function (DUF4387)
MPTLRHICKAVRSKQAGPYRLTFDLVFGDAQTYQRVKDSGNITPQAIADLYGMPVDQITHLIFYDPGYAVKITMIRPMVAGSPGDGDIYGCQQHAPLLDLEIE